MKWFTLAADKGDANAQAFLGLMYYYGEGIPQDYKTALKWYTLAAEKGDANAQAFLGLMYGKGDGVSQDNVYAYMWVNIAASNGNENGGKLRDIVAKLMTPTQIEKAQDLARECIRKEYKGC
ncbi:sel1 repeat family protein [Gammaproteobacteria bacterium]|nr:sel1 repeat family protein [Gammaproteobacteria bacterium]